MPVHDINLSSPACRSSGFFGGCQAERFLLLPISFPPGDCESIFLVKENTNERRTNNSVNETTAAS